MSLPCDFLDPADNATLEHDFDTVGMIWGFRQDSQDDALGELARSLVLLFDDPDFHAGPDIGASLPIH